MPVRRRHKLFMKAHRRIELSHNPPVTADSLLFGK